MSLEWIIPQELGLFRGPATVGIIKGTTGWILIDSTVEAEAVKKVIKALAQAEPEFPSLKEAGKVSVVINTHAHADHCGGNAWLQKQFQSVVYASAGEAPYIEAPEIEPHYLYSANAPKPFWNKFFCASSSHVNEIIDFKTAGQKQAPAVGESKELMVDGIKLYAVRLPGHSPEMIGVITESGYFYCGDLLFTPQILAKHPLLFLHDPASYMASLEWAMEAEFNGVILTHGGFCEDMPSLVSATMNQLKLNAQTIESVMNSPMTDAQIHIEVAKVLSLEENLGGWHLNHGVIRSYLGQGLNEGRFSWSQGLYYKAVQVEE